MINLRHAPLAAVVTALALGGCSGTGSAAPETGLVRVVASTDVYGDIAAQVGGEHVEVTSLISGAAVDPHSYEATVQDELALSRADLVLENGGGYDPFVGSMIESSGSEDVVVISATEASGLLGGHDDHADDHADGEHHGEDDPAGDEHADEAHHDHIAGFNEHVWYDLHGMHRLAEEIARALAGIDPDNAAAYQENAAAFATRLEALEERAAELSTAVAGAGVVATEPVAVYLLEDAGFENVTPDHFAESLEAGIDVAPAVLQETLALVSPDTIALLAYNAQTSDPVTDRLRQAAESAGVPVVSLTETLPDGQDYLEWMASNLDAIETALR